jgi:hypothetical protein
VTKGGRQDLLSQLFGRQQANLFILPMLKHFQEYLQMRNGAIGADGLIDAQYAQRMQNAEEKVKSFTIQVQNLGEAIGETALKPVGDFAGELAQALKTLDKRVGVFDKLKTSVSGLIAGFGIKAPGGTKNWLDSIFGTEFDNDKGYDNDPRVTALARLSNKMRGIGRNFRAFVDDISAGNVSAAMHDLGAGLKDMSGSMTVGGAIAIGLTGAALLKLGQGAAALTFSKAGQIAMMAWAVATLIDAAKDANSLGEFADNLSKLSTFDWVVLAGGIGLAAAKIWRLTRGMRAFIKARREIDAVRTGGQKPKSETSGNQSPNAVPKSRSTPRPWGEPAPPPRTGGPTGPNGGVPRPVRPAPVEPNFGGALKSLFSKGSLLQAALLMGGEWAIGAGMGKLGEKLAEWFPNLYTPEKQAKAQELGDKSVFQQVGDLFRTVFGGEGGLKRFLLGAAADPGFNFRDHMSMNLGGKDAGPSDVSVVGVPEVSIPGPITTQPSGTQDVRVTNPTPAPVVNITVNAQTNDPQGIVAAVEKWASDKLNALSRSAYSDGAN